MLALTTYPEPRNLLIDLAFFGLSTITNDRPDPLLSAAALRGAVAFGLAADLDALGAERFAVLVSGEAAGLVVGLADLRATVSSYPFAMSGLWSTPQTARGRRESLGGQSCLRLP